MIPLLGLLIGLIVGLFINFDIPSAYSPYVAVVILAIVDSILGAIVANMQNEYRSRLFISGLFGNSIIAVSLAALGEQLDLPLNLAAIFAFGNRIFINFSKIRRMLIDRYDKRKNSLNDNSEKKKTTSVE
jgi:small basic protein